MNRLSLSRRTQIINCLVEWPLPGSYHPALRERCRLSLLRRADTGPSSVASDAVSLLAEIRDNGGIAPEATPEPAPARLPPAPISAEPIAAPVPDAVAARRAKWAIAKRASRALAKAKVHWRGDPALTAAAGAE
jgi:hypothetical protein